VFTKMAIGIENAAVRLRKIKISCSKSLTTLYGSEDDSEIRELKPYFENEKARTQVDKTLSDGRRLKTIRGVN
jgi:hypothetical protein